MSIFFSAPRLPHLKAAHKIPHYLKGTIGQALLYHVDDDFQVKEFYDSDWSQCPDLEDLSQDSAYSLATLWFLGNQRSKTLFLIHQSRLNTDRWLTLLRKSSGYLGWL